MTVWVGLTHLPLDICFRLSETYLQQLLTFCLCTKQWLLLFETRRQVRLVTDHRLVLFIYSFFFSHYFPSVCWNEQIKDWGSACSISKTNEHRKTAYIRGDRERTLCVPASGEIIHASHHYKGQQHFGGSRNSQTICQSGMFEQFTSFCVAFISKLSHRHHFSIICPSVCIMWLMCSLERLFIEITVITVFTVF